MPLAVPFDYRLDGSPEVEGRRVRICRVRYASCIPEEDYDRFAVALWTLSRKPDANANALKKDQELLFVAGRAEVADDSSCDIDRDRVCAAVGKERLLELATALEGSVLSRWFHQEADLLEEEPNQAPEPTRGTGPAISLGASPLHPATLLAPRGSSVTLGEK